MEKEELRFRVLELASRQTQALDESLKRAEMFYNFVKEIRETPTSSKEGQGGKHQQSSKKSDNFNSLK